MNQDPATNTVSQADFDAYNRELELAFVRYGSGHHRYARVAHREALHFLGSILFIIAAALVTKTFFTTDFAFYALLVAAVVAVTLQEFWLHPKIHGQHHATGIVHWIAWTMPIGVYVFLLAY